MMRKPPSGAAWRANVEKTVPQGRHKSASCAAREAFAYCTSIHLLLARLRCVAMARGASQEVHGMRTAAPSSSTACSSALGPAPRWSPGVDIRRGVGPAQGSDDGGRRPPAVPAPRTAHVEPLAHAARPIRAVRVRAFTPSFAMRSVPGCFFARCARDELFRFYFRDCPRGHPYDVNAAGHAGGSGLHIDSLAGGDARRSRRFRDVCEGFWRPGNSRMHTRN